MLFKSTRMPYIIAHQAAVVSIKLVVMLGLMPGCTKTRELKFLDYKSMYFIKSAKELRFINASRAY